MNEHGLLFRLHMHPEIRRLREKFNWTPERHLVKRSGDDFWTAQEVIDDKSVYTDDTWGQMNELIDRSWWFATRSCVVYGEIKRHLGDSSIWDLGCGNGQISQFLNSKGFSVVGIEPSMLGAKLTSKRGIEAFCAQFEDLQLPDNSIGAISMFDVLEHLPDRKTTLDSIYRSLEPGGSLVLTIPAMRCLWSQFDVDGGHFIRYNRRTIKSELESVGFDIRYSGYFFVLTIIPILLLRALPFRLGIRKSPDVAATVGGDGGRLRSLLVRAERWLAFKIPAGSSLFVIARKTAG